MRGVSEVAWRSTAAVELRTDDVPRTAHETDAARVVRRNPAREARDVLALTKSHADTSVFLAAKILNLCRQAGSP